MRNAFLYLSDSGSRTAPATLCSDPGTEDQKIYTCILIRELKHFSGPIPEAR